jgi:hypothetical protein
MPNEKFLYNRRGAEMQRKLLKHLLPQKTRRAQKNRYFGFLNFAHFCVLCGRKIFSLCTQRLCG